MKIYLDGSKEAKALPDSGWLTLAAFWASDPMWSKFDCDWEVMLMDRYPIAPYIHMSELIYGDDPFERINGWDTGKKNSLVINAVALMRELDKKRFQWLTCHLDLTARTRLASEGYAVLDPFKICADICVANSMVRSLELGVDEQIYIFFDRGESFILEMKNRWLEGRTAPGKPRNPDNVWDCIADVQEQDMKNRPGLQAADMMAWSCTRSITPQDRYWAELRAIMQTVLRGKSVTIDGDAMRRRSGKLTPG